MIEFFVEFSGLFHKKFDLLIYTKSLAECRVTSMEIGFLKCLSKFVRNCEGSDKKQLIIALTFEDGSHFKEDSLEKYKEDMKKLLLEKKKLDFKITFLILSTKKHDKEKGYVYKNAEDEIRKLLLEENKTKLEIQFPSDLKNAIKELSSDSFGEVEKNRCIIY